MGELKQSGLSTKSPKFHYAWIIAGIAFLTLLVSAGVRSTPGVLMIPLEKEFGWGRTIITFSLAINLALYGICGPFAAALINRYGIKRIMVWALIMLGIGTGLSSLMKATWQLTILWGLVVGLGTGFTSSVLGVVIVNEWFTERRGLVTGLLSASVATGQLVFLPLLAKVVVAYGWQAAVWVPAISAFMVALLVIIFMRDKPNDLGILPYGSLVAPEKEPELLVNPFISAFDCLRSSIRYKDFWLLAGSFFVCGASTNGLIGTHFIPASIESGIPEVTAAGLLAFIGIFNMIGTTVSGWLSDRFDNRWLLFWYYGLRGMSLFFLPHALGSSFLGLVVFIVFYGLDWVATVPPTVRMTTEIFGKQSGVVFGWIFASHQIGAATAALGGGALHTWLGDYQVTFISAGILAVMAAGLVLKIRRPSQVVSS